jgi:hypothetical protein
MPIRRRLQPSPGLEKPSSRCSAESETIDHERGNGGYRGTGRAVNPWIIAVAVMIVTFVEIVNGAIAAPAELYRYQFECMELRKVQSLDEIGMRVQVPPPDPGPGTLSTCDHGPDDLGFQVWN